MNPLPAPGARRRSNVDSSFLGEAVSIDTAAGTGVLRIDGSTFEFSLHILTSADLLALINATAKTTTVQVTLNNRAIESVNVVQPSVNVCGACDNPILVKEPPIFVIREFNELTFPEISVVLVSTLPALCSVMGSIQAEKYAIGLDVVRAGHIEKSFVCICVSSNIFAIDSSAFSNRDMEMFLTYLSGYSQLEIPVISPQNGIFAHFSPKNDKLESITRLILKKPVLPGSTLESAVEAKLAYSMDPILTIDESEDPEALPYKLGRGCFHSRQIYLLPTAVMAPPSKRLKRISSPSREPPRRRGPGTLSELEILSLGEDNAKKYLEWFQ